MKQKILLSVLIIMIQFLQLSVLGQNRGPIDFKYNNCVKEVSFGGTLNSNYVKIIKDGGGDFLPPHFISGTCSSSTDEVKPVAYVASTQPRTTAILNLECLGQPIWVSALVETSNSDVPIHFYPAFKLSPISNGSNEYHYKNGILDYVSAVANNGIIFKFPVNKTLYIEEYKIKWRISPNSETAPNLDDNTKWEVVGESKNTVYVTYSLPILSLATGHEENTMPMHTLLHIGCKNADKKTSASDIVNGIYDEFKDNKVKTVDGNGPIKYWGFSNPPTPQPQCWQPSQMLKNLDGRCGGWAAFFQDVIRLQGIATSNIAIVKPLGDYFTNLMNDAMSFFGSDFQYLDFTPINGDIQNSPQFYVKNWNIDANTKFFINECYNKVSGFPPTSIIINGNSIPVLGISGVEAQGNNDPRSEFRDHGIVKFDGKYYDPSYGTGPFTNADDWENHSLKAFGSLIYFEKSITNPNGITTKIQKFINHKDELNTTAAQVTITP